jgi:hypothetical protein
MIKQLGNNKWSYLIRGFSSPVPVRKANNWAQLVVKLPDRGLIDKID